MLSVLVDFLNHGILPFVGRSAETESIVGFWRSANDAPGLRTALILGEAGIGKSRLVDEVVPTIVAASGAVIHARLYPDSTSSIASLIARALGYFNAGRNLLIDEPEETITSVASALRRICRLRPTLLVLEDIHLLEADALKDFGLLLDLLSHEVLSLLCLGRPVELPARPLLERHLVSEIELQGLKEESLDLLWHHLFAMAPDPDVLRTLRRATFGNPLALRSALRGAIKSGALIHDAASNSWRIAVSAEALGTMLSRNVEFLSEGMAAHLSEEEKRGAGILASLGEIFSPEAAETLLPGRSPLVSSLIFKGIIAPAGTAPVPLPGFTPSSAPMAFTHTLLHKRLVESAVVPADLLLQVIASGTSLYSTLPIQLLAEHIGDVVTAPQGLVPAIDRVIDAAAGLHLFSDNDLALSLLGAADRMFSILSSDLDTATSTALRIRILRHRLTIMAEHEDPAQYELLTLQLAALTLEGESGSPVDRLITYTFLLKSRCRLDHQIPGDICQAAELLIGLHPELQITEEYILYLQVLGRAGVSMINGEVVQRVESMLGTALSLKEATDEFRRNARFKVFPYLLLAYSSEQDVERRMEFLGELDTMDPDKVLNLHMMKISFLVSLGKFADALPLIEDLLPRFEKQGERGYVFNCHRYRLCFTIAFGGDLDLIASEAEKLCSPPGLFHMPSLNHTREVTAAYIVEFGMMRGDAAWAWTTAQGLSPHTRYYCLEVHVLAALDENVPHTLEDVPTGEYEDSPMGPLVELALGRTGVDLNKTCEAAISLLQEPLLRVDDTLTVRATISLLQATAGHWKGSPCQERLRGEIRHAILRTLEFLAARQLFSFMTSLVNPYDQNYLTSKEQAFWCNRITELALLHSVAADDPRETRRIRLSMLGSIHAERSDIEILPIRGARLRALLGVMVADRMLDTPLTFREIGALVTGIEGDDERARKMLNGVIHRLRDVLGHEAITTGEGTPRLNLEIVQVDLLEAHALLKRAAEALQERSLPRAKQSVLAALKLSGEEVPFPALYDNFFEALREDFEQELRSQVMKISKQLLLQGDPGSAEEILRAGCRAMPEDEEMEDLLCEALVALGKRVEAQRIRMRMTAVSGQ